MQAMLELLPAFMHSNVKNTFSQSPQYIVYTNMATATQTYMS